MITYAIETTVINKKEEEEPKINEQKMLRIILDSDIPSDRERRARKKQK